MSNLSLRIKQARKAAKLSLRALADLIGLSHAAIKKYEDADVYPSSDVLFKLSKALNVRVDFFFRPSKVSLEGVKFRKRKKLRKKAEEQIKFNVIDQIERRLELEGLYPESPTPSFELPDGLPNQINNLAELESVAELLRTHWKLGLLPIYELIDALETCGVRVFIVDSTEKDFDGLSTTINNEPIIVVSSRCSGDRQRFSLMHELAHYILKERLSSSIDEERACDRLAGAMLLPREILFQSIGKTRNSIELQELLLLKEQFQISMSAICHRLKDLKIITPYYHRNIMIQFSKRGWHTKEPGTKISPEKTHIFKQLLFHALGEDYIGEAKAAELLSCSLRELKILRQIPNHARTC